MSSSFNVTLTNFTGPFDLLLQLLTRHKLDVTEVALSVVTDEFITHVRMGQTGEEPWDLDQTTSFLVVAATLLDLKAARLLPQGEVEEDGRQRWFTLSEINELRRRVRFRGKSLMPERPKGPALRVAVSNFKGGVGKTVVAQHLANAAALDGYLVLVID